MSKNKADLLTVHICFGIRFQNPIYVLQVHMNIISVFQFSVANLYIKCTRYRFPLCAFTAVKISQAKQYYITCQRVLCGYDISIFFGICRCIW